MKRNPRSPSDLVPLTTQSLDLLLLLTIQIMINQMIEMIKMIIKKNQLLNLLTVVEPTGLPTGESAE